MVHVICPMMSHETNNDTATSGLIEIEFEPQR
jgi:hypothetical protein